MKTSSKVLFDTNVLIYNQDIDSPYYQQAHYYHELVFSDQLQGIISSQNLLEFSAVMTNDKKIPTPLTHEEVSEEISQYIHSRYFPVIYPNKQTLSTYQTLLNKYALKNPRQLFDLFLVATMIANQVSTILTANAKDFQFEGIKVMELKLPPHKPGALKGKIRISDDFDAVDKEIETLFNEGEVFPVFYPKPLISRKGFQ